MKTVNVIYFSPTHTTKKVALAIAKGLDTDKIVESDFTKLKDRQKKIQVNEDIAVIAVPVHFGRVQEIASAYLKDFVKAINTKAILVAVYGNRDYDDALVELYDIAKENGFDPVACAAFVGEHTFISDEYPVAKGRPDKADLKLAESFGKDVKAKIAKGEFLDLAIKGNRPYKDYGCLSDEMMSPIVNDNCTNCKLCAVNCPTGAIDPSDVTKTDQSKCIYCHACFKNCPFNGRDICDLVYQIAKKLKTNDPEPKEPEFFI